MTRAEFEEAILAHRERSVTLIANFLSKAVLDQDLSKLDDEDLSWIMFAAAAAYRSMGKSGVDFTFSQDGKRWTVVT